MDIVPELTEPGEPQGLVGDPARTVIDHENKPASQQQQPYKSEKTADHASPYICRARQRRQPITGLTGKFNLISTLSAFFSGAFRPNAPRKALTLQGAPLIRPAMAAGAILPPLFFERRRDMSILALKMASSGTSENHTSVDHAVERPARLSPTT
jgi:hypothetical protein